jgi:hypothetical protein
MQAKLDTTTDMKSRLSIVPKDPENDLIPLIDKIGIGVIFIIYDDFKQPREIA